MICAPTPIICAPLVSQTNLWPNKVKNMFLVLLPGHFFQAVKPFLLTIQIILWIALHKNL